MHLESGDKVKASVQFRGRDMLYTEKGELLLLKLAKSLEDVSKVEAKHISSEKRYFRKENALRTI